MASTEYLELAGTFWVMLKGQVNRIGNKCATTPLPIASKTVVLLNQQHGNHITVLSGDPSTIVLSASDSELVWQWPSLTPADAQQWRLRALRRFLDLYAELRELKRQLADNRGQRFQQLRQRTGDDSQQSTALSPSTTPSPASSSTLEDLENREAELIQRLDSVRQVERLLRAECESVVGTALLVLESGERARVAFMHRQMWRLKEVVYVVMCAEKKLLKQTKKLEKQAKKLEKKKKTTSTFQQILNAFTFSRGKNPRVEDGK